MDTKRKAMIAGTTAVVLAFGGVGVANAVSGGDDGDSQTTGSGAAKAKAAALALIPGGTANSVERDGENGATWEVEVSRRDGSTVDVRLDANYQKVIIERDSER